MKKSFKKILVQSFIAFISLCFFACQEYEINSQPEAPLNIQIDALEEYTVLASSPSNVVFNISSNTPWTIECDQQWCTVTPSMSASSSLVSEIVVKCEPNNDSKQRVATLTVKAEGIESVKTVKLTQVSKENLVVIPYDGIIPTDGGAISFNIVSNKPWEIIPSTQFLENIDKTSGAGNETGEKEMITITVPQNTGAVRKGTITVRTEFETKTFEITQNGIVIEPENEDEKSNLINGLDSKTIKISASEDLKVEVPQEYSEWLDAKIEGSNLTLTTKKYNNLFVERIGHVLLSPKRYVPGFEGVPVEVRQSTIVDMYGTVNIDEGTGFAKIINDAQNRFSTKFRFVKGRLIWTFDEFNINGNAFFDFNFDRYNNIDWGAGWLKSEIKSVGAHFTTHWVWDKRIFNVNDIKNIKSIEISILDNPTESGKVIVRLLINDEEIQKCDLNDPGIQFEGNTIKSEFNGWTVYFGFAGVHEDLSSVTFKTFDYIPAE